MSNPRPLLTFSYPDPNFGPANTFPSGETVISEAVLPYQAGLAGTTLTALLQLELSAPTGTATVRVRRDDAATGTVLVSLTATIAGITSAQADFTAPLSAARLFVTGQVTSGTVTASTLSLDIIGDAEAEPPPPPPDPSAIVASSVELLSQDSLLLTFAGNVVNNASLRATTNYTIVPVGDGIPVRVVDVLTGSTAITDQVVLVFTRPLIGTTYTVTASGMNDEGGLILDPTTKQFVARFTKMDNVLRGLPSIYTRGHRSSLRSLLQALSRVDESIGGNRSDTLT